MMKRRRAGHIKGSLKNGKVVSVRYKRSVTVFFWMKPEDCAGYPDTRVTNVPCLQVPEVTGSLHTML